VVKKYEPPVTSPYVVPGVSMSEEEIVFTKAERRGKWTLASMMRLG